MNNKYMPSDRWQKTFTNQNGSCGVAPEYVNAEMYQMYSLYCILEFWDNVCTESHKNESFCMKL